MRSFYKILRILLGILLVTAIILFCIVHYIFPPPATQKQIQTEFTRYYNELTAITDYIINLNCQSFYVGSTQEYREAKILFDDSWEEVYIEDQYIADLIYKVLHNYKYMIIGKTEECIYFQRSTKFRDFANGVVFIIQGDRIGLQMLTKYDKISSDGKWYYYEEDFNKWKQEQDSK